jgi:hypothetical protein
MKRRASLVYLIHRQLAANSLILGEIYDVQRSWLDIILNENDKITWRSYDFINVEEVEIFYCLL